MSYIAVTMIEEGHLVKISEKYDEVMEVETEGDKVYLYYQGHVDEYNDDEYVHIL